MKTSTLFYVFAMLLFLACDGLFFFVLAPYRAEMGDPLAFSVGAIIMFGYGVTTALYVGGQAVRKLEGDVSIWRQGYRDANEVAATNRDHAEAEARVAERYMDAIRRHRDEPGPERCWLDDERLYAVLPEGYTPPERAVGLCLSDCERFLACRLNPDTEYVSPQRRIEELEGEVARLRKMVRAEEIYVRKGQA